MKRLVILISDVGTGSNMRAIYQASKSGKINAKIIAVVSDTKNAEGLTFARVNKIPVKISPKKEDLRKILEDLNPDFIVLAGWKQIITDELIDLYKNKILNLHPGLIPNKLGGNVIAPDGTRALHNRGLLAEKAIENFLNKKSTYAGSSIHFLTHDFDFGPVLERGFIKIKKKDSVETLYKRLKKKEHQIYINALKNVTSKKTLLIVDGGGRGHALAGKYRQSSDVGQILVIPGNDLVKLEVENVFTFPSIKTTDLKQILAICKEYSVDFVDVAQDNALEAGLVNYLSKSGIKVFGPTKKASEIEWNKAFARNFMKRHKLPIPQYKVCDTEKEGVDFIKIQRNSKWYVKASGLAGGKGALFANNNKDAIKKIKEMKNFKDSGKTFLIEECLPGEEFSAFALVSGKKFQIIEYAQDHKTLYDGDRGPNTGGMGCTARPLLITKKMENQVNSIFKKTVEGLYKEKRKYLGILYLGGIIENENVKIIEFNARWGDPEAQVIIPSIKNDYFSLIQKTLKGSVQKVKLDKNYKIVITIAAKGYPENLDKSKGKKIKGLEKILENNKVRVFGSGIKKVEDNFVIDGGRVFYVSAVGKNIVNARKIAYNALSKLKNPYLHYRKDIGYRDTIREKAKLYGSNRG